MEVVKSTMVLPPLEQEAETEVVMEQAIAHPPVQLPLKLEVETVAVEGTQVVFTSQVISLLFSKKHKVSLVSSLPKR